MSEKTFRVPKRVREQAKYGLANLDSFDGVSSEAWLVAHSLTSGDPVSAAVPHAMIRYFADNMLKSLKIPVAQLYGGKAGKEWAKRCGAVLLPPPRSLTAAVEKLDRPAWDLSDDEVDAILAFARSVEGMSWDEIKDKSDEGDTTKAAEDLVEDVEKLQESSVAGEELAQDDFEQSLAEAALAEVAPRELSIDEYATQVESAKSRIEQAAFARKHRELAARMAGATQFQGTPILPIGDEVGRDDGEEGGAGPKV